MNRADKRRQKKITQKGARNARRETVSTSRSLDLAVQHHNEGHLPEAEKIYQQVLQADPNHPVALHLLGLIAHQTGNNDKAVELITKAIAIKPDYDHACFNMGIALNQLNRPDEAISSYRKALAIRPDYGEAHNNLGVALKDAGDLDAAISHYRKAIVIKPDYVEAHNNLGVALFEQQMPEEALASYRQALTINPDYAEAHNNMGNVLRKLNNLDEAEASYRKAISIKPDYAGAFNNLGNTQKALNKLEEAISSYQMALTIRPDYAHVHSNALLTQQYRHGHTAQSLYKLHRKWDEDHGHGFRSTWPKHPNTPEADRRLRIGFVSPDLGRHPVGYFVVLLFENLPEGEFKKSVYSDYPEDDLTERIKAATDVWHDVRGLSDESLAHLIIDDAIDILIDLTGHSADNRLLVFARKPAPLQVSWAGYTGTTGLAAMDYLISDKHSTRPEEEPFYQEKIIRMPDGWVCYDPPDYAPDVGEPPFKRNGFITFGSISNPAKINDEVVSAWTKILCQTPDSHLLIKYTGIDSDSNLKRLTSLFKAGGIDASRLTFEGSSPHDALLARYNDIDIALDPFPYSGGLTTHEALWMGVPVITYPGETFASRHSFSHLMTVGLPELVACDKDDYVMVAVKLAGDEDRLAALRAGLRDKMARSAVCDGEKFAMGFGVLMRNIWRDWCASREF